jgi:hypothetical protein
MSGPFAVGSVVYEGSLAPNLADETGSGMQNFGASL